jgi:hypothetical protein
MGGGAVAPARKAWAWSAGADRSGLHRSQGRLGLAAGSARTVLTVLRGLGELQSMPFQSDLAIDLIRLRKANIRTFNSCWTDLGRVGMMAIQRKRGRHAGEERDLGALSFLRRLIVVGAGRGNRTHTSFET